MSDGALLGPMSGEDVAGRLLSDAAWLQAMLDVEAALAGAQARVGLVPAEALDAIAAQCAAETYDLHAIGREAAASAGPVEPLVRALRAKVAEPHARFVHFGASSQDIVDTALMCMASAVLSQMRSDLRDLATACAEHARAHRSTLMVARTLLQHAGPTTFGLKAAGWLVAVDECRQRVARVRCAVQLGGASGTLAAMHPHGPAVMRLMAESLGLDDPVLPWHTNRTRVADIASVAGTVAGVLGKIAHDVVLLAQTDVGELSEDLEGPSSSMPQKRNPARAVAVRAVTRRVPMLVSTLLASMDHEHERAAGAWQAEWDTLRELLRLVSGATAITVQMTQTLRVNREQMRANLDASGGIVMADGVAAALAERIGFDRAQRVVREACVEAMRTGRSLRTILAGRAEAVQLPLDELLDPATALEAIDALVERALSAHGELEDG